MIALHLCALVTGVDSGPSCEELLLRRREEEVGAIWPERDKETTQRTTQNLRVREQLFQVFKVKSTPPQTFQ